MTSEYLDYARFYPVTVSTWLGRTLKGRAKTYSQRYEKALLRDLQFRMCKLEVVQVRSANGGLAYLPTALDAWKSDSDRQPVIWGSVAKWLSSDRDLVQFCAEFMRWENGWTQKQARDDLRRRLFEDATAQQMSMMALFISLNPMDHRINITGDALAQQFDDHAERFSLSSSDQLHLERLVMTHTWEYQAIPCRLV